MSSGESGNRVSQTEKPITWDAESNQYRVTLLGVKITKDADQKEGVRFTVPMPMLNEVRIRKKGDESWIVGIRVPIESFVFLDLEHGIVYEVRTDTVEVPSGKVVSSHTQYVSPLAADDES
jgi:hypothetical protein